VYRLAETQLGVRCISFRYDSPSDLCVDPTLGIDVFELPFGMAGVPRFSNNGPTGVSLGVGRQWTAPTVFSMEYDELGGSSTSLPKGFEGLRCRAATEAFEFTAQLRIRDPFLDDTNGRTILRSWAKEKRPKQRSSRRHSSW
jgi:hypothetical protein